MKIEVEISDDEIVKKFKLKEKKKYEYLKKTIRKYIIEGNPKHVSLAECVVDVIDDILYEK